LSCTPWCRDETRKSAARCSGAPEERVNETGNAVGLLNHRRHVRRSFHGEMTRGKKRS